jgi:hypothetical protein
MYRKAFWPPPRSTPPPAVGSAPWSPGDKSARDAAAFVDHVAERLAGIGAELTALQEFSRPAFHRQHLARLADQFQGWRQHYNTRRRNHGDFTRARPPFAVMEAHLS